MVEPQSKCPQTAEFEDLLTSKARDGLVQVFGELAASEALARALVAERTEDRPGARMWIAVYHAVCDLDARNAKAEIISI